MPRVSDFANFAFVAGAPRCGTTTLARLLGKHPQVRFSLVKEPHFFAQHDLRGLARDELEQCVERDYLDRFFDPPSPGQIGADGSVSYLYVPEQMEPILKLWPDARFIIGLRDPMTLLPSLHQRLIFIGDETLTRFEDAWAAVPDRAAGRRIPRTCADPRWLRYDEAGRFGTYVERFFDAVGRERCLIILFDDLVADPQREFQRVLEFAGLDASEPIDMPRVRESRQVRWLWLQRFLKRPPVPLRHYLASHSHRRRFGSPEDAELEEKAIEKVLSIRKRLLRWNRVDRPPEPVPIAVQMDIQRRLRGEIDHLGRLIGRDLGHWLQLRDGSSSEASP